MDVLERQVLMVKKEKKRSLEKLLDFWKLFGFELQLL